MAEEATVEEQTEETGAEESKTIPYDRFAEVNTAKKQAETELRKAREALKRYEGFDPEEYQRLKEAAEEAEQAKLSEVERVEAKYQRELEKREKELTQDREFIRRVTVDNELNSAMDKAGVLPEHRRAVRALLKEAGAEVVQEDGEYRGYLGSVPITEYVEDWAKTDEAAHYIGSSGASGSGAVGGGGATGRKPYKDMSEADKVAFIDKHGKDEFIKHMQATK